MSGGRRVGSAGLICVGGATGELGGAGGGGGGCAGGGCLGSGGVGGRVRFSRLENFPPEERALTVEVVVLVAVGAGTRAALLGGVGDRFLRRDAPVAVVVVEAPARAALILV